MKHPLISVAIATGLHVFALVQLSCHSNSVGSGEHSAQFKLTKISMQLGHSQIASPSSTKSLATPLDNTAQAEDIPLVTPPTTLPSKTQPTEVPKKRPSPRESKPKADKVTETAVVKVDSHAHINEDTLEQETVQAADLQSSQKESSDPYNDSQTASNSVHTSTQAEDASASGTERDNSNSAENRINRYIESVRLEILKQKRYPKQAKLRRHQGSITVAFTLTGEGEIRNIKLLKKSSSKYLNKSVRKLLRRVHLPAAEQQIKQDFPKYITLTLDFSLETLNS
ncbi:TonB family protein [Shewanella eurypsychrophilus]|uniref:Protein TonB n=1 Tax=Shewanella eurypsychrophilus TaxID=2593656 RepID=A0ABX6V6G7_9GAMM|nr:MULTISPECIES: TonB family protein [Shewanella]QFU22188.1 TonB family protein [Shewanella sp. YLB-09]QPG57474.1 TonB family protein [Shewanella eurypsychrophilus]